MNGVNNKCLFCYKPLIENEIDFHLQCSKKFFGSKIPKEVPFNLSEIEKQAIFTLQGRIAVTGVQPKISLDTNSNSGNNNRLPIVGMMGNYILKPPVKQYPEMPEIEDLTMHLAELLKIKTAQHSLIKLKSGELAYITKRFDRDKNSKLAMEDMAQLTGMLTENKYRGSMEKIGKVINQFSNYAMFDLIRFYELTLFCFITGNADMHLKNFSLLTTTNNEIILSPAYDLLSTKLLTPDDLEEIALTLNGKKNKIKLNDFKIFAAKLGINNTSIENVHKKFIKNANTLLSFVDESFLTESMKNNYKNLLKDKYKQLFAIEEL